MTKRTTFTTITPLPPDLSRDAVLAFLHNHLEMIDLNPLIKERHPIPPPPHASADEQACVWYSLTDEISYLPGIPAASSAVSYTCAFNDLPTGLQTHCYAPMGLDIRDRWSVAGTLPGEAPEKRELGLNAPSQGLYLREDVDMRCNVLMTGFVKKTLKKSHGQLVDKLAEKARAVAAEDAGHVEGQYQHQQPQHRHQTSRQSQMGGYSKPAYNHQFTESQHSVSSVHSTPRHRKTPSPPTLDIPSYLKPPTPPETTAPPSVASSTAHSTPGTANDTTSPSAYPSPLRIRHQSHASVGHDLGQLFDRDAKGDVLWQSLAAQNHQQPVELAGTDREYPASNAYSDLASRTPWDEATPNATPTEAQGAGPATALHGQAAWEHAHPAALPPGGTARKPVPANKAYAELES
ncbi:hypothetical protein BN1723_008203, partial [Verticillium longisporum]